MGTVHVHAHTLIIGNSRSGISILMSTTIASWCTCQFGQFYLWLGCGDCSCSRSPWAFEAPEAEFRFGRRLFWDVMFGGVSGRAKGVSVGSPLSQYLESLLSSITGGEFSRTGLPLSSEVFLSLKSMKKLAAKMMETMALRESEVTMN